MIFRKILVNSAEAIVENKLRSALTMLGMIIGVMAVILLVSVGTGAKRYITSEFESLGTNVILVQPGKTDKKNSMGNFITLPSTSHHHPNQTRRRRPVSHKSAHSGAPTLRRNAATSCLSFLMANLRGVLPHG